MAASIVSIKIIITKILFIKCYCERLRICDNSLVSADNLLFLDFDLLTIGKSNLMWDFNKFLSHTNFVMWDFIMAL